MKRRFYGSWGLFLICMLLLAGRLYYIQIVCHDALSSGAQRQQQVPVLYQYSRGTILDRNKSKLTDTSFHYYYLVHQKDVSDAFENVMLSLDGRLVGKKGEDYLVYLVDKYDATANFLLKEKYHAYGICVSSRYEDNQIAAHLIGYLNASEGKGISGLEQMYEDQLNSDSPVFHLYGDGIGNLLYGTGIIEDDKMEETKPAALITTIDSGLQKRIEDFFIEQNYRGAAVVMDTQTGQVLAMISCPDFNPNQIERYLHSESGELTNKVLQGQYPPGSVFKIIVAAAALEEDVNLLDKVFFCDGKVRINGVELHCGSPDAPHGKLNLSAAFAKSCNCYFAKLAKEIGSEPIVETAKSMGLGEKVFFNYPNEEKGNLPTYEERFYSGLSNLSIGQGSLLATPMQICQMTNIVANKGFAFKPSLILSEKSGNDECHQVIQEETADAIVQMMSEVMKNGTGASAKLHNFAAGKTGSAEAFDDGEVVVHGWFTGFFPVETPKYTITVLIENGETGSKSALPVFQEITQYLRSKIVF